MVVIAVAVGDWVGKEAELVVAESEMLVVEMVLMMYRSAMSCKFGFCFCVSTPSVAAMGLFFLPGFHLDDGTRQVRCA